MKNLHYRRILWNLAVCLFVYCILLDGSVVADGIARGIVFLALAGMLLFVVEHSAQIHRAAAVFFERLRLPLFALVAEPAPIEWPLVWTGIPDRPTLSPLFQRPPPIS